MYLSMGHMIGLPLPPFLEGGGPGALVYGLLQLALTVPVCWINRAFFISGWNGLRTKAPGMDALVSLGAGAALVYGVFALIMMAVGLGAGDETIVLQYRHDLYFESAAMILTLITVGKTLEAYSKGRTTDALKSLMQLTPQTATVLRDGKAVTVPVSEVAVGDIFFVKPGEAVPVDGTVAEGVSSVNEAALTGESMPVDKFPGSPVSAATINQNGALACRAERVGQDTTLSQVIRLVRDAAATKAPLAKTADKVSAIFVPAVIAIAVVTFLVWLLLGQTLAWALARGISVLVISCPCALGLATPVAIMVGSGVGAKHGILQNGGQPRDHRLHRHGAAGQDRHHHHRRAQRGADRGHPPRAGKVPAQHGGGAGTAERTSPGPGDFAAGPGRQDQVHRRGQL